MLPTVYCPLVPAAYNACLLSVVLWALKIQSERAPSAFGSTKIRTLPVLRALPVKVSAPSPPQLF